MYLQNSKLKNFTPLPNEIFSLHLTTGELAVYALLLRLENRETHECWPSYETIEKAIGKSKSSVKRYVAGLVEKGLITVEPTSVIMQNGLKKNGNLRYHIRPIREAVEWYTQHQLYLAEAAAERQQVQQKLAEQAEDPHVRPCEPLCGLLRGGTAFQPRRGISSRFRADFRGLPRLCGGQNRAPAEAQRSGFGGKRRSSGMIEFSPSSAETWDMKLAPTRSRIKGWRRYRRSACPHLPAVRTVYGGFQRSRKWRLLSKVLQGLAS